MALIHPNEWQIMLKSERLTRDFQMACFWHAESSKNQSAKETISLFSAFYACTSKRFRIFAPDNNNRVPNMAEIGLTFSVGVQNKKKMHRILSCASFFYCCLFYSATLRQKR
jgi:hypothetical protein